MFKYIYQLNHKFISNYSEKNEPLYNETELGYFSHINKAKETIKKYKGLDGFKDHDIKCFEIKKED